MEIYATFDKYMRGKRKMFRSREDGELVNPEIVYQYDPPWIFDLGIQSEDVERGDWEEVVAPFMEIYATFDKYMYREYVFSRDEKTGRYGYWEHPNVHVDRWLVGGGWTGIFDASYDPEKDPANFVPCYECCGPDIVEQEWKLDTIPMPPPTGIHRCSACNGIGAQLKQTSSWRPFEGDVIPIVDLLVRTDEQLRVPMVIVTPQPEWIVVADGFADAATEDDWRRWKQTTRGILSRYENHAAVVVDCTYRIRRSPTQSTYDPKTALDLPF
jgi:hypothetical protein